MTPTNNYSCALGCGVFVSHAELQQHLHSEHIPMNPTDDQELDEILNKEFSCDRCRYTHQLINVEFNQAREQLLTWRDAGILKELEKWDACYDGCVRDRIKELKGKSDVTH